MDVQSLYNLVLQLIANSKEGGELPVLETLGTNKSFIVLDPADGKLKTIPKSNITFTGEPPTKLTDLTDTPNSKLGQAGKILVVNEDETAFEYLVLGDVEGVSQSTLDAAIAEANAYAESLLGGQVSPTRIDSWVLGYDSGLTFNPTFNFTIDGVPKTDSRQITLAAADGTNPRVDVFVVNLSTEQIEVLTGTPAANPAEPDVDFSLYLKGPTVYLPAGATTPANIDIKTLYNENLGTAGGEADVTGNADYDFANTENPDSGTYAIKVTGELVVNQILGFSLGTDLPIAQAKELQLRLQNITTGGAFHITVLGKRSNGRTDSLQLPAPTGFDPANIASYQTITLPIVANQLVSIHEVRFVTEVAGYKFYLDKVRLIGGEGTPTQTTITDQDVINALGYTPANDSEVVKSVSLNGGTPVTPVNGNVDLTVSGGGVSPSPDYNTVALMLADQANQTENVEYTVTNASGWSTITHTNWATFKKKAASTASESDYDLREQFDADAAGGLSQSDIDNPKTVSVSRPFDSTDIGKILFVTANITLTYPSGGIAGFKCNIDCSETGQATIAGADAELSFPFGKILPANKMGTLFLRPDDGRLRGNGEFTV